MAELIENLVAKGIDHRSQSVIRIRRGVSLHMKEASREGPPDRDIGMMQLDIDGYKFRALLGRFWAVVRCRSIIVVELGRSMCRWMKLLSCLDFRAPAAIVAGLRLDDGPATEYFRPVLAVNRNRALAAHSDMLLGAIALGVCGPLLFYAGTASAASDVPPPWQTVYDFLVQDVCVDRNDSILADATPLDDPSRCPVHRNLKLGEALPYHKHDWPVANQATARPDGYQSNDTLPLATRAFGRAVLQLRSFRERDGAAKPYRPGLGGGGGLYVFSDLAVASAMTEDPAGGFQFFYGPDCGSPDLGRRLLNSWVVVDRSFAPAEPGHMVARLTRNLERCGRPTFAYTSWKTRRIEFRVRTNGIISRRTLEVLVSDHFAGQSADTAGNLERFYYARELGLMRWERWQNLDRRPRAGDTERAASLESSERCDPVQEIPDAQGHWVIVRCRQYTNLVRAKDPEELQYSWLAKLRADPATRDLLGDGGP